MYDEKKPALDSKDAPSGVSQNAYFAYLSEISQYKLLSAAEEISLFQRIQNGDDVARDLFIKSNLRLVVKEAKKYYLPGHNQLLDLIQDGNLGLLRAVEKYDPNRGYKFSTYAVYHIHKAIQRSSCRTDLPLELPPQKISFLNKLRFSIERLEIENGTPPTYQELAAHLGVSIEKVISMMPFLSPSISWSSKVNDESGDREFIDVFSEHYSEESNEVEREYMIRETQDELQRVISEVLNEKEAYILSSRMGLFGAPIKEVSELAKELHMSKQGVRQSEERSIAKLRKHLLSMDRSLIDFLSTTHG